MGIHNPFALPDGAQRYRAGRPFHHARAIEKILSAIRNRGSIKCGLDLGCGTGLSTVALAECVPLVVGIDITEAMLRMTSPRDNTFYVCAAAERLPLGSGSCDFLTVSSAIHWFDQQAFFAEAARVLLPGGCLAIYDHFFRGARDEPVMNEWLENDYATRYPRPQRGLGADKLIRAPSTFVEIESFEYDDPIAFTHDELIAYLLSHSNTIAAVRNKRETSDETREWLRGETGRWFDPPHRRTFVFRGVVHCLSLRD